MTINAIPTKLASAERLLARARDTNDPTEAREAIGKAYQMVHISLSELKPNLGLDPKLKDAYADLKRAYALCFDGYRYPEKTKDNALKAKKWVAAATTIIVKASQNLGAKAAAAA